MFDLYFLHKSVVKEPNDTTFIFFLFNFRSLNKALFTISILSSELNRGSLFYMQVLVGMLQQVIAAVPSTVSNTPF